jgi:hypothetical protein
MALDTNYIEELWLLQNVAVTGSNVRVKGGNYIWEAEGTFGGATLQLQAANANGTMTNITGASMTANGFVSVELGANALVRVTVTGGSPANLYSTLVAVP